MITAPSSLPVSVIDTVCEVPSAVIAVKLRTIVPEQVPDELRRSGAFRVEVDALPGGFVCSGALKGNLARDDVRAVITGQRPLRKRFLLISFRSRFHTHGSGGASSA